MRLPSDNYLQIGNPLDEPPSPSEYWLGTVSVDAYEKYDALPKEAKRKIDDWIEANCSDWSNGGSGDGWLLSKIDELTE